MSVNDIRSYFKAGGSNCLVQSHPQSELESLKLKLYEEYKALDHNKIYTICITSKYNPSKNDKVPDILGPVFRAYKDSLKYNIFPALQKNGRIHYHGLIYYKPEEVICGVRMLGRTEMIYLNEELNFRCGRTEIKSIKEVKTKNFDFLEHLGNYINYIFSEENYLGVYESYKEILNM